MPDVPAMLVASGFRGARPKVVVNECGAVAVGSVFGLHGVTRSAALPLARQLRKAVLDRQVVPYSNGMLKLEVGQWNAVLARASRYMLKSRTRHGD